MAALAAIQLMGSAAHAADLAPVDSPIDWSGAYIGLNAGAAFSRGEWDNSADPNAIPFNVLIDFTAKNTGFIGGGQIGYNHQINQLVLGIEGDLDYLGIDGNNAPVNFAYDAYIHTEQKWLGSVVGRLGYASDRLLIYGTAGVAFTSYEFTTINYNLSTFIVNHPADDRTGWTAGAGAEYAVTDKLTAGIDFRHYDFGRNTLSSSDPAGPGLDVLRVKEIDNVIKARINYKF
jgi:outer membrane immunogenic protein